MKWKLGSYLVTLCLVSLAAASIDVQAASIKKKEQKFVLAPKNINEPFNKKPFINFSDKFDGDAKKLVDDQGNSKIKFKSKPKKKQQKKSDAVFDFGAPVPKASGDHEVSVEMVSLSLVSVNEVSLDPLGEAGKGKVGSLVLNLLRDPSNPLKSKSPVKLDDQYQDKKDQGKKGKGTFVKMKASKKFKVSAKKKDGSKVKKKDGSILSKTLAKKDFKASGVGFASNSPISITDPSFCLENGDPEGGINASICLAPMVSPVPLPGSLALMAPALAILLTGHIIRRRRRNGGGSRLAA